jgi:hypothetical protein
VTIHRDASGLRGAHRRLPAASERAGIAAAGVDLRVGELHQPEQDQWGEGGEDEQGACGEHTVEPFAGSRVGDRRRGHAQHRDDHELRQDQRG